MTDDDITNALNELMLKGLVEIDAKGNYELTESGKILGQDLLKHVASLPSKKFH